MKLVDCQICGEPFQTSGPGKYCEGCRGEARKRRERKALKSCTQALRLVVDKNNEARAAGLSYGQYVALTEKRKAGT